MSSKSDAPAGGLDAEKKANWTNEYKKVVVHGWPHFILCLVVLGAHWWFLAYLENEYEALKDKKGTRRMRDYVDLWAPIFIISIVVESAWCKYKKSKVYRLNDTLSSVSSGTVMVLSRKVFFSMVGYFPFAYVWENFRLTDRFSDGGALSWWMMFIATEFGYYWAHRHGHTVSSLWAMHSVHHSSEEYNLSTALRQSVFGSFTSWLYYVPFALLFPPSLFLLHAQFNLLYQFWIHTQTVGKLGPLEYILNTPSQHRVHHGKNPYCIDKNYGGTLCIFDRLFNTFQEEIDEIPIVYGTIHPINTFEPVAANLVPWYHIVDGLFTLKGLKNKLGLIFQGPGWIPGTYPPKEFPIPPSSTDSTRKYDPYMPYSMSYYIAIHSILAVIFQNFALEGICKTTWQMNLFYMYTLWSFVNIGWISDRKPWTVISEIMRLVISLPLGLFAISLGANQPLADVAWGTFAIVLYVFTLVSSVWILLHKDAITKPLHKKELGKTSEKKAATQQEQQYREARYVPPPHLHSGADESNEQKKSK